jgi:isoleucyl-tRNA synthetase
VLVHLAHITAPFTPFLAEELYQKLTGGESVHLLDWPRAGTVNEAVIGHMNATRKIIEQGLGLRMYRNDSENQQQIKIRQPLANLSYSGEKLDEFYENIILEEVNVKSITHLDTEGELVTLDKVLTSELKREGLMREVIRHIQSARKNSGLNVDDHIKLQLVCGDDELSQAIADHQPTIQSETLADEKVDYELTYVSNAMIDGLKLEISLEKI